MCNYICNVCSRFIQSMKIVGENSRETQASPVTYASSPNGMPRTLLITSKNGRRLKTYGVNQVETYNMKLIFLCIAILISCSECISQGLELYPGLEYRLNPKIERSRLESVEDVPLPRYSEEAFKRWPWPVALRNIRRDYDYALPENLQDLIQGERTRDQILRNENRYRSRQPYEETYENDQDDFTFKDDDEEEEEIGKQQFQDRNEDIILRDNEELAELRQRQREIDLMNERQNSEAKDESEALSNAKVVEDPTEFAYAPPDPRFYENSLDSTSRVSKGVSDMRVDHTEKIQHESGIQLNNEVSPNDLNDSNGVKNVNFAKDAQRQRGGAGSRDVVAVKPQVGQVDSAGVYIIAVVAGISAAATVGLIAVGIGWYNLQKHVKNATDVEYPAYGVTGPNKDVSPSGDRRLAQSAQMYHYQHQKQQIIAMERAPPGDRHGSVSEADSDEENEEGDYTVYECPGLAPTGEMEVKNPLFQDDPTPAQTPPVKPNTEEKK